MTEKKRKPVLAAKAVAAVVLGNALEFYDFTIYAFFAVSIGNAFFPAQDPTDSLLASLALFGVGYVMRPIGGVLIGAYADKAGRKPAMLLSIGLMALGMLILALTPGYDVWGRGAQISVFIARLVQGLALGGEVGPATAYLLEAAPEKRRAFIASWQIASQGCAALFSGLIASILTYVVGEQAMGDYGWRAMFLFGTAIVPAGLFIRSRLPETTEGYGLLHSNRAVLARLWRDHKKLLGLVFLVIAASTVSNSIGTNMVVYARSTLGLTETVSGAVPIALGLASILFPLLGGWLADHSGRKPLLVWPRIAILLLSVPVFYGLVQAPTAFNVYAVTFLMSALSSINAAAIITAIPESLPRTVRSAGLSIVYALSVSIFGGSTNYVVNKLIAVTGDRLAPAYYLMAFSVFGVAAALLLPETRGKKLD